MLYPATGTNILDLVPPEALNSVTVCFVKRSCFDWERELRIISMETRPPHDHALELPISISTLVEHIRVSPDASSDDIQVIREIGAIYAPDVPIVAAAPSG